MTNRRLKAPFMLIAVAGLATLATPTIAQEGKRPTREAQQAERPTLSGPRVREQRVPGTESGFSAGTDTATRRTAQPVPPQVFRKALGELMSEDAPLAIRLSPEQRERISTYVRAFEREFRTHRDQRSGQQRDAVDRPTDGREPESDRRQDRNRPQIDRPQSDRPRADERSMDRRQSDRQQRPKLGKGQQEARKRGDRNTSRGDGARALAGLQTRIWAELSAAQQAHVGKAIEASRAQAAESRMGQMRERYRREIGARFEEMDDRRPQRPERSGQGGVADTDKSATELRQWFSQLPQDVRQRMTERLESMPAERREAVIARAIEMSPEQRTQLVRRLLQSEERESPRRRPQ